MKKSLMKIMVVIPLLMLVQGCGVDLCKCLNSGPYYDNNEQQCKNKFRDQFGSSEPSLSQMKRYSNNNCGSSY